MHYFDISVIPVGEEKIVFTTWGGSDYSRRGGQLFEVIPYLKKNGYLFFLNGLLIKLG